MQSEPHAFADVPIFLSILFYDAMQTFFVTSDIHFDLTLLCCVHSRIVFNSLLILYFGDR